MGVHGASAEEEEEVDTPRGDTEEPALAGGSERASARVVLEC